MFGGRGRFVLVCFCFLRMCILSRSIAVLHFPPTFLKIRMWDAFCLCVPGEGLVSFKAETRIILFCFDVSGVFLYLI
jgi:hypothetical protein